MAWCSICYCTGGFITTYCNPVAQSALETSIQAYDDVLQGAGAGLGDLAQLRAAEKVGLPKNIVQATFSSKSFKVLLHALLGPHHQVTTEFDAFLRAWTTNKVLLDGVLASPDSAGQVLRWVQLRLSNWFVDQIKSTAPVPSPDLCRMLSLMQNTEPWAPALPPQYACVRSLGIETPFYTATQTVTHATQPSQLSARLAANNKTIQSPGHGESCSNME
jgi:hypothetical protein